MALRILRGAEVRALLPMADCIEVMRHAMVAASEGRAVIPLRSVMTMPGERRLGSMPGYLADPECFGVKLVSLMPRQPGVAHSSHLGVVVLFEARHGQPVALIDAAEVTALRTAAVSALATGLLARADAGDLALLGAGEQAVSHLDAMRVTRPLRRVRLWARDASRAAAFAAREGARHGLRIEVCATVADAVRNADLVCTVTAARDPILCSQWLSPGVHLNVVGSSIAAAAEVDSATVARARFFVDRRESTVNEGGEYLRALAAGVIGPDHILGEIGAVARGDLPGRLSDSDVTLYKSLGIAVQDLASAHELLQRAERAGVGQVVEF
ncbi:MAG: ornithine cyclodeaminase family protein [Proteobacteria bacterium]|nr:ornithine cyclodeaminase family protein [Pseudomonadota bacterium]